MAVIADLREIIKIFAINFTHNNYSIKLIISLMHGYCRITAIFDTKFSPCGKSDNSISATISSPLIIS